MHERSRGAVEAVQDRGDDVVGAYRALGEKAQRGAKSCSTNVSELRRTVGAENWVTS